MGPLLQAALPPKRRTNPFTSATITYRWHDLNGTRLDHPGEVNDDPNGPDFISSNQPVSGISNPDEKPMGTDQFALTVERELGTNFAVRASGVYIRTFNEQRLLNVLRPWPTRTTGRSAVPIRATTAWWGTPTILAGR